MIRHIITPDHPQFYEILHSSLPPGSTAQCYAPDAETGILKPLDAKQEQEFCYGGEMDLVEDRYVDEPWLKLT